MELDRLPPAGSLLPVGAGSFDGIFTNPNQATQSKRRRSLLSGDDENTIVRVNAGGLVFVCLRGTLCQYPGSVFSRLLSDGSSSFSSSSSSNEDLGGGVVKDESGAIFLDVQPALFEILLNELRLRRQVDPDGLRELPAPAVPPALRRSWIAMLCYLHMIEAVECVEHRHAVTFDPQFSTIGPGDQVQVMEKGCVVVGHAAHGLSLVSSQVFRPGKAYFIKLKVQRAVQRLGVPGPTDMRWGFVRERSCQQEEQMQQQSAAAGGAAAVGRFFTPDVGADHRCSWPCDGGLFLLKLDLRAAAPGGGGGTLSVLNLNTRKEARTMEVPYEAAGWRMCGSFTGASSLHSSAEDVAAQEERIAALLATAGGLVNSKGLPVVRGRQASRLFGSLQQQQQAQQQGGFGMASIMDMQQLPPEGQQREASPNGNTAGRGVNLGAAFANGLSSSFPAQDSRRGAESYYCGITFEASARKGGNVMMRQQQQHQQQQQSQTLHQYICSPEQRPCASCEALSKRYVPSALLWGDLAIDLPSVSPIDLLLLP